MKAQIPKIVVSASFLQPNANIVVRARDVKAEVSELPEYGGLGNALTPLEYMLASLASCEAFMFGMISSMLGTNRPRVEITVEGEFEMGIGLKSVKIVYHVKGVDEAEAAELLRRVRSTCPVYNTLAKACDKIEETLIVDTD
ncbi:MAG: OsmC family protein [Thermosphaera sp.]